MSEAALPGAFSARGGLALVVVGVALFLALAWMIATGIGFDDSNDGGSHAGGKGLNGFAGLVRLAAADGWDTALARHDSDLNQPGLLVLTPAPTASGPDIARIVSRHRRIGPVMVIAPKWVVEPLPRQLPGARKGWVALTGVQTPGWPHFLDRVTVGAQHGSSGAILHWRAAGLTGRLPDARAIETGSGSDDTGQPLIPLVQLLGGAAQADTMLAAYVGAARATPALDRLAIDGAHAHTPASIEYPLILVFEPDLLDNYGLADRANAVLASRLLAAAATGVPREITFDLTLDGLGAAPNLLTLAFAPPYLAVTLCLILAALAAGWRTFCRFGDPRPAPPDVAFGKARLVENSGALILRARRLHLLGPAYVAACRERIVRALALPRQADVAATDAAIDRALAARQNGPAQPGEGFATAAQTLHEARGTDAIVAAAGALYQLERMLIR